MLIGIAKTSKGVITLPDELRNALGDAEDVLVVQQDDGLFLKRIDLPRQGGLLEISDKLIALNATDPITPDELEAEIAAARAERRANREGRA
ncbi:MAG: hypothetical protein HY870_09600 [Chloroflexi bacterium]|nr:hypothetical protein [Chloroflexota bacterium]